MALDYAHEKAEDLTEPRSSRTTLFTDRPITSIEGVG